MPIRSRLLKTIEESGLSVFIFSRDYASLTWCFDELVNMIGFMSEMRPDAVFPVSYDAKQSKIDDQIGMYTIVFDKDEEEEKCRDDAKVKRWMNILIGVENYEKSGVESWKSIKGPPQFQGPQSSKILHQYQYFMLLGQPIWQKKRWPILWQRSPSSSQRRSRSSLLRSRWVQPLQRFQTLESLLQQLREQP
ncbi:RESISTANCE PROTEIN (TIR-NBS-LRR CLASS) putative-RELATED [Salix purpurea]|uniref:ADP-ribosyl cyclase/cyclic ADP-ribose hydrolase n=1 Tax=Salix purpurea TaxID=77065 RepID=A0A9Q0UR69_SALPP|nr:RESISTANCE PROTEIN (TIR-NBS-LRR CLASS) putative-RELATED [Salix purpurea]